MNVNLRMYDANFRCKCHIRTQISICKEGPSLLAIIYILLFERILIYLLFAEYRLRSEMVRKKTITEQNHLLFFVEINATKFVLLQIVYQQYYK